MLAIALFMLAPAAQGVVVAGTAPPVGSIAPASEWKTGPMIVPVAAGPSPVTAVATLHQDPPPPPIAIRAVPVVVEPSAVAPIRVRVAVGTQTLFDDELRVGRGSGASYSESRSEAPSIDCSADRYYGGGDRSSLSVQLYLRDEVQTGPAVNLNVTWQRPASTNVCPNEGTRSVSLTQTVPLAPGQSATVRADGGLSVTLSRR